MKNNQTNTDLKGRPFRGKRYAKSRPIHSEPRQRIRQLLRSFPLVRQLQTTAKTNQQIPQ